MTPFARYVIRKEELAAAARLSGFCTVQDATAGRGLAATGNAWTRRLFDGDFYRGGGETDTHLIYEGLSRVDADAVLAGAATARSERMVFSVWHPELVALRLALGHDRHPAQVVVTEQGDLPFDRGLMFTEPSLRVFVITRSPAAALLRAGLVRDLYLTTSPIEAGEPDTPFCEGVPPRLTRVLLKAGRGDEAGVRFEHFLVDAVPI